MTLLSTMSSDRQKEFETLISQGKKIEAVNLLRDRPVYVGLGAAIETMNEYIIARAAKIGGSK